MTSEIVASDEPAYGAEQHPYFANIGGVERRSGLSSREFLERYAKPSRPVILTDLFDGCLALNWTVEHLSSLAGDRVVPIEYSLHRVYRPQTKEDEYHRKPMRFEDGLRLIQSQRKQAYSYYISTIPLSGLPELNEELAVPHMLPRALFRNAALFIGNDGTGTQFHYDLTNNFLVVFKGQKRIRLVAPSAFYRMYPLPMNAKLCNFSRLNIERPDCERFPKARNMYMYEAIIGAGEAIYLPALWWHDVANVGLTIGATIIYNRRWWTSLDWPSVRMKARLHFLFHMERLRRGLARKTRS